MLSVYLTLNAQVSDLAHGAAAQDRVCTARASQLLAHGS